MTMEITNKAVAECVMGWTQKLFGRGKRTEWVDANDIMQPCFYPLDCSDDDYQVFNHVRSEITERSPRYANFYHHLRDVLQSNPDGGPAIAGDDHLHLMHWYRVGDYSRAAMMAIYPGD